MIERTRIWLDVHPRIRFTLHTAAAAVAALFYIGVFTLGFGIFGAIAAGLVIFAVNLAGPIEFTSIDAVWGEWTTSITLGAIIGAIAGVIHTLRRLLRTNPDEYRGRPQMARDLVAQAVVAQRIGAEDVRLQLGILGGGDVWWSQSSPRRGGPSAADQAFDRLTVAMANPSLTSSGFLGVNLRRTWFAEISRLAEEIVIHGAAAGTVEDDPAELIRAAARRAQTILAVEDGHTMTAIRAELRIAGRIRNDRLETLLGPVPEEPVSATQLSGNEEISGLYG